MNIQALALLDRVRYSRHRETPRPTGKLELEMIVNMVKAHAQDEEDFEDALDTLEDEAPRYTSIDGLTADYLFDELTFLLCGCDTDGYDFYTIGTDRPLFYIARMYGSNSVGAVFTVENPVTPIMVDSDKMFYRCQETVEPELVAKMQALCRSAGSPIGV